MPFQTTTVSSAAHSFRVRWQCFRWAYGASSVRLRCFRASSTLGDEDRGYWDIFQEGGASSNLPRSRALRLQPLRIKLSILYGYLKGVLYYCFDRNALLHRWTTWWFSLAAGITS
jgi:hypothetical protein